MLVLGCIDGSFEPMGEMISGHFNAVFDTEGVNIKPLTLPSVRYRGGIVGTIHAQTSRGSVIQTKAGR